MKVPAPPAGRTGVGGIGMSWGSPQLRRAPIVPDKWMPRRGPGVCGAVDMLSADRIGGWAIDQAGALEVDPLREGRRERTGRGRTSRGRAKPRGNHGFAFALKPPPKPGFEFTVAAVARADADPSPRAASCALGGDASLCAAGGPGGNVQGFVLAALAARRYG